MQRLSTLTGNRAALSTASQAVCCYCLRAFHPVDILEWCDEDQAGVGQTALCPHCGVDAIVAFAGDLDDDWLRAWNAKLFS